MSKSLSTFLIPKFVVRNREGLLIPSIIVAVLLILGILLSERQFANEVVTNGQITFEFLATYNKAVRVLGSLTSYQRQWAIYSIWIDYIFMVAYVLALQTICVYRGNANDISIMVGSLAFIAALFDGVENAGILSMLNSEPHTIHHALPTFVTIFATIKFVLVAVPIVYSIKPFGRGYVPGDYDYQYNLLLQQQNEKSD